VNNKLTIKIAKSLLLARWRQTAVAAVGVTFSIAMFIALLSFMIGLNDMLDDLVMNRTPHVRLYNEVRENPLQPISLTADYKHYYHFISSVKTDVSREEIYNSALILKKVEEDKRTKGISKKINLPVFFNEGNVRIPGTINGIDVQAEIDFFHFNDYVNDGLPADLKLIPSSIIPGKALAEKLHANIGDMVYVTTSTGETFPLKVVAYFQSGLNDLDKAIAYTSLSTAQKMVGRTANYITEIQIKLKDIDDAPMMAKEYNLLFKTLAEDIQTANADFDTGNAVRSLISYIVGITLLIVAGFGIYNILNMMIYEKMDSIAILKATGFSAGDVRRIFLFVSLSIGLFGGLLGLAVGYLLSRVIDAIPFVTASMPTITTYPVDYDPIYYVICILFSLVTTFLAGWLPAVKAGKLDPVVIIRGK
jgi:lipoprotein-releasing system permease protein